MALKHANTRLVAAILRETKPLLCPLFTPSPSPVAALRIHEPRRPCIRLPSRARRAYATQSTDADSEGVQVKSPTPLPAPDAESSPSQDVSADSSPRSDSASQVDSPANEHGSIPPAKRIKKKWTLADRVARERARLESQGQSADEVDNGAQAYKNEIIARGRATRKQKTASKEKTKNSQALAAKKARGRPAALDATAPLPMDGPDGQITEKQRLEELVEEAGRRAGLIGPDETNEKKQTKREKAIDDDEEEDGEVDNDDEDVDEKPQSRRDSGRRTPSAPVRRVPTGTLPDWGAQKAAVRRKLGEATWAPRRRLSPDTVLGIQQLHELSPEVYNTPFLAEHFKVSPEAIRRILKSKWEPSEMELTQKRERWARRHDRLWDLKSAVGQRPERQRDRGIEEPVDWEAEFEAKRRLEEARAQEPLAGSR